MSIKQTDISNTKVYHCSYLISVV